MGPRNSSRCQLLAQRFQVTFFGYQGCEAISVAAIA